LRIRLHLVILKPVERLLLLLVRQLILWLELHLWLWRLTVCAVAMAALVGLLHPLVMGLGLDTVVVVLRFGLEVSDLVSALRLRGGIWKTMSGSRLLLLLGMVV